MEIIQKPSPNFTIGRENYKPELIVIHIMAGTLTGTDSWFANPNSQVSAHFGIGEKGEVHQYVSVKDTAYHAGGSKDPSFELYKPGVNPNLYTIGIEHEGSEYSIWPTTQKAASAELIRTLCQQFNIPIDRKHIIGHYQVTTLKPNCPAVDKSIIDELVKLAAVGATVPGIPEAIAHFEAGTAILKGLNH